MATALAIADSVIENRYQGTYLNRTTIIAGNLFFEAAVCIDGRIDGDIVAKGEVTVGETAVVTAGIQAPSVLVYGRVRGDVTANNVELRPTAKVVGNITSAVLKIDSGATLDGRCFISGSSLEGSSQRQASDMQETGRIVYRTSAH